MKEIEKQTSLFSENPIDYLINKERLYHQKNRYLRKCDDAALKNRRNQIHHNLWTTDKCGNVQRVKNLRKREFLLSRLVELEAEVCIRHKKAHVEDINEKEIRNIAPKDYKKIKSKKPFILPENNNILVRYMKKQYAEDAFYSGSIRIAPASSYDDPSLNSAQFDDELKRFSVTSNECMPMQLRGLSLDGKTEEIIPHIPLELYKYDVIKNFYMLCLSSSFDYRMFSDFEADAAIIIHDKKEFISRLCKAVSLEKKSINQCFHKEVQYYDPYQILREQLNSYFFKHFQYLYQDEYRFIWETSDDTELSSFFVNIGSMQNIADIVTIE